MAKKLSGWHRIFIIFAVLWTIFSIIVFYFLFPKLSKEDIEQIRNISYLLAEKQSEEKEERFFDIEASYKGQISEYQKGRKNAIRIFPLFWLAPIGLVYGSGLCVGWIIRGFRKDKE